MTTYNLLKDNNQFFIRFENNIPYVYIADASGNLTCWSGITYCSERGGFIKTSSYYALDALSSICSGSNVFTTDQFEGEQVYYSVPWQIIEPPSSEIDNLCNGYSYNFTKKIKITIHDDPIFSGVYVFDYDPNNMPTIFDSENITIPGAWTLNTSDSDIGIGDQFIIPYNYPSDISRDPDGIYSGERLISLEVLTDNSGVTAGNQYYYGYNGYFEAKQNDTYDPILGGASNIILNDSYAFPCNIIMTAIVPSLEYPPSGTSYGTFPNTCTRYDNPPSPTGVSHRLVAAFKIPIRYRYSYGDWIVVDKIPMTVSGIAPNYSSVQSSISGLVNINLQNSNPIDASLLTQGYYLPDAGNINSTPVCTGINYSGTVFKVSATGINLLWDSAISYRNRNFGGRGLGKAQNFVRFSGYYINSSNECSQPTSFAYPEDRWFEPKIPIKATIEFVYSCRNRFPQCSGDLNTVASTYKNYVSDCIQFWGSNIDTDYYCNTQQLFANDNDISTINNIQVIYSGYYNPILKEAYYIGLAGYYSGLYVGGNGQIDLYYPINTTGSQVINIPYTGTKTIDSLRYWINNYLGVYLVPTSGNTSGIPQSKHNVIDLFLSTSGTTPNRELTAKIFLQDYTDDFQSIQPKVYGAGIESVNGIYEYSFMTNGFVKAYNLDLTSAQGSPFWLKQLNCNDPSSKVLQDSYWVIGSGTESNFIELYQYKPIESGNVWAPAFFTPNTVTIFSGVNISYGSGAVIIEKRTYYV